MFVIFKYFFSLYVRRFRIRLFVLGRREERLRVFAVGWFGFSLLVDRFCGFSLVECRFEGWRGVGSGREGTFRMFVESLSDS